MRGREPTGGRGLARRRADPPGLANPLLCAPAIALVVAGCCVPLAILLVRSFAGTGDGAPWTLDNYETFATDAVYWRTLLHSILFVGIAAAAAVAVAFPFAYFVALRVPPRRRRTWIVIAILPFTTSYLIRVFAWLTLLGDGGVINDVLMRVGVVGSPLDVLDNGKPAIVITFIYLLFPLAFLMSYVAIERMDPGLLQSASDLGASPWRALLRVVLPIGRSGVFASFAFCFIAMMGDYLTPTLIGGTQGTLFSNLVVNKFGFAPQWGLGSALAVVMLLSVLALLVVARQATLRTSAVGSVSRRYVRQRSRALTAYSTVLLLALYAPVLVLVLFAFNDSDLVGFPIQGLTLRWFASAFDNTVLLEGLRKSLDVAAWSVSLSVTFGTLAAVQLSRTRGVRRSIVIGILALPLLLPPAIMGLGIIVALHALDVSRGLWTVIVGHTVLLLPVVAFVVLVRLDGLDPALEVAAADLGARPWRALVHVTLPLGLPAIVAAALLAVAMSMDEFILTFLVTGHDVTLPLFIYGAVRYSLTPEVNALCTVMLGASFALCGLAALALRIR